MAMTERGDGVHARTESPDDEAVVVADLDLEQLRTARRAHPLHGRFNLALDEKYLPRVNDAGRRT